MSSRTSLARSPTRTRSSLPAEPRYATERTPGRASFGAAVARLAAGLGTALMPWQRQVADVALEVDPDTGEWAYPVVVVTVPRQAGKTTLVAPVALHRCLTGVGRACWYTAQTRQDARDNWLQVARSVARSPLGTRATIRLSNGSEGISFPNDSAYRVFAPAENALHGKANHLVTIDEAWSLDTLRGDMLTQAIVPTFTTTGGQLWVLSTAGTGASSWLRSHVDAGRAAVAAGRRGGVAYFEWGITDEVDPADLAAVAAAHPARGYTLRPAALAQAAAWMKPGEFARAYGNRWTAVAERVIAADVWAVAAELLAAQPVPGAVALGWDVAVDEADAAIVAAWRDGAGRVHIEVLDARAGAGWVPARLVELAERWQPVAVFHDAAGPAGHVADAAKRAGVDMGATNSREYAAACAGFLGVLVDGVLRHRPDPALDAAVGAAAKRPLGDAWAWARRGSAASIAPLVAATVAVWALDHGPERPGAFRVL